MLEDELFNNFCRHMSASINVVDVMCKLRQLGPGVSIGADDPFILVSRNPKLFARLVSFGYSDFVQEFISRLRIEVACYDVFRSEMNEDELRFIANGLLHFCPRTKSEIAEAGFVISSAFVVTDIILPVVSRLHEEVLQSLHHFCELLDAVGGNPQSLFLNAKSPTPESQFVQFWVASKLNIPTVPFGGVVAVI